MPVAKISREEAIDRIADVFRRYGYDGASLRLISKAAGLGRASLYHHFPGGKAEIARAVFRHLGEQVEADILAPLREGGTPDHRLEQWIQGVNRFYDHGCKNCLLGTMVLSGGVDRFSKELAEAFRSWIEALSQVLRVAGVPRELARRRAESAVGQIQGALVVSRGLGDEAHFERVLQELPRQLLKGG